MYIQVWRAYWWLFCFGCCLRSVIWSSHDDACMMGGRCWYCHLASAYLCGTLESGRLIKADVQAILGWNIVHKLNWIEFIYLYYTTGNQSDIDHNANNEADGPFKWIYVIIGTDFCCIRVFIIVGLSKVNASLNKPDWGAKSRPTLRGILDIANTARYEADGPFMIIYVKSWQDLCWFEVYCIMDSVYSQGS